MKVITTERIPIKIWTDKMVSGKYGVNGRCKHCKADYMRSYYAENREVLLERCRVYFQTPNGKANKLANTRKMIKKYPNKYRARYMASNAIRAGKVKRGACETCGTDKVEAHHDDYDKPLELRWFCMTHHKEYERKQNIK